MAPFATISMGRADGVDGAAAAAQQPFPEFSSTTPAERIALLERVVRVYTAGRDDLSAVMAQEIGIPKRATVRADGPVEQLTQANSTLKKYQFETSMKNTLQDGKRRVLNQPVQAPCAKISYALATGNDVRQTLLASAQSRVKFLGIT